jgi:hypothetical protein
LLVRLHFWQPAAAVKKQLQTQPKQLVKLLTLLLMRLLQLARLLMQRAMLLLLAWMPAWTQPLAQLMQRVTLRLRLAMRRLLLVMLLRLRPMRLLALRLTLLLRLSKSIGPTGPLIFRKAVLRGGLSFWKRSR